MPLPKQARVPEDRIMKAPYNFVPLPDAVLTVSKEKQPNTYDTLKHTGLIELRITTETLLYTRCAYPPATEDEKVYRSPSRQQFFHHGNPERPYLPGSSIRGMLRSLMEIITYSKVTNVYNERLVYRGAGATKGKKMSGDTGKMIPPFLKNPDDLDMAEALFGSTERKGRVRVVDAALTASPEDGQIFLAEDNGRMIPKILSSPKPTSFQNYLVQPEDNVPKVTLKHYDIPFGSDGNGTVIRGYKQYWNKLTNDNDVREDCNRAQLDDDGLQRFRNRSRDPWRNAADPNIQPQHTVIKPVRPGCVFGGRICFENLSDLELGALLTALRLEDTHSRHRLGMGKPYGMGRIRIEYVLHLDDRKARYHAMDAEGRKYSDEVSQIVQTCLALFSQKIMDHHITCCGGSLVASIWDIPRLKDFSLLMNQHGPNLQDACYVSLDAPKPWRDRNVLPAPQQVMNFISDETVHGTAKVSGSGNVGSQHPLSATEISGPVKNRQKVTCVVLAEQTKKKKWRFKVKDGIGVGTMHPTSAIPDDIEPGKEYRLTVFSNDPKNMMFTWEP